MIPADARFWGEQIVQAYAEADGTVIVVPEGWTMVSRLNVTERALFWTEHSLIGFILNHPVKGDAVVLRGTINIFDWIADLAAIVNLDGICIGFDSVYAGITLDGGTPLGDWLDTRQALLIGFYGHSMGASVATIGAKRSLAANGVKPRLLTFASPRTLDILRADALASDLTPDSCRIANLHDLVPDEPPPLILRHVLNAQYVDSASIPTIGTSIVDRHQMATYLQLLPPDPVTAVQSPDVLGSNSRPGAS